MSRESERLFAAMSDLDDKAVDEAAEAMEKRKKPWFWKAGLAAALVLMAGAGSLLFLLPWGGGGSGGAGSSGASTFMSYAGPVFPLTLREANGTITAQRDITLDFAPWLPVWEADEDGGGWYNYENDVLVTDAYTLTNASGQDQTVSVLYPFASDLSRVGFGGSTPTLSLNGQKLDTVLYAGNYTGGYMGAWGSTLFEEESPGSVNLDRPDCWEDYRDALSGGDYLEKALAGYPDLSGLPVAVYEFTDAWGPEQSEKVPNPSLRASFRLDFDKTTVFSTGFHAMRWDPETGEMTLGFSIPEPDEPVDDGSFSIIVLGDDIRDLTLQGYVTGGVDDEPKVEAGATVTRYESSMEEVLRRYAEAAYGRGDWENRVSFEMYFGLMKDQLLYYGLLAEEPMQMYTSGFLSDLNFASVDRVFYLEAEVTIPAGGSVTLAAEMRKEGSYDFYCANTENRGIYGYDLVTELGSNLDCAGQTASLEDRGQIEIVRNNFGFDLEKDIRSAALDPAVEHYYLEVRRVNEP